jgi:hypothetical protein
VQFSGLPVAGFLGSMKWSSEGEIGCPVQSVNVSQIYDGEAGLRGLLSTVTSKMKTLQGAKAPAAMATPIAIVLYYLYREPA